MRVDLLYFDDCPNWRSTLDDLQAVMSDAGRKDRVNLVRVSGQADAERLQFPGSPTVRLNGQDVENNAQDSDFGLKCRIYWHRGRAQGTPPRELLQNAIRAAGEST